MPHDITRCVGWSGAMISLTRRSGVTSHTRERVHPTGHLGPLARNSPIGVVPPGRLDCPNHKKNIKEIFLASSWKNRISFDLSV